MTSEHTHFWVCERNYFWNWNSNTEEINKRKKRLILSKLLRFSRQEWIQKIKLFVCYTENDTNKNWTDLSLSGQEPTFKTLGILTISIWPTLKNSLRRPSCKTGIWFTSARRLASIFFCYAILSLTAYCHFYKKATQCRPLVSPV